MPISRSRRFSPQDKLTAKSRDEAPERRADTSETESGSRYEESDEGRIAFVLFGHRFFGSGWLSSPIAIVAVIAARFKAKPPKVAVWMFANRSK